MIKVKDDKSHRWNNVKNEELRWNNVKNGKVEMIKIKDEKPWQNNPKGGRV